MDFSGPTRGNKMGQNSKLQRGQNCIGRGQSVRVRLPMPINVSAFMIVNTECRGGGTTWDGWDTYNNGVIRGNCR